MENLRLKIVFIDKNNFASKNIFFNHFILVFFLLFMHLVLV